MNENGNMTFEDASRGAQETFENAGVQENGQDLQASDGAAEENGAAAQETANALGQTEAAVSLAENAAAAAEEYGRQYEALGLQMEELKKQNEELTRLLMQTQQQAREGALESALEQPEPAAVMPELDFASLAFDDEDTVRQKQNAYAQQMAEFVKSGIMQEMAPYLEQAKAGLLEKEKNEVFSVLSQVPELSGIDADIDRLDRIIDSNDILKNADVPLEEKYITAYAIAKGAQAINNPPQQPKEPDTQELMRYYENNPQFREAVERRRLEELKNQPEPPRFDAGAGLSGAALKPKNRPQTFSDAHRLTENMFRG